MCEFKSLFIKFSEKINSHFIFNEPLSKHTSFRIGGPADILYIPQNINSLKEMVCFARERRFPIYVIGQGTNLLVRDCGIRGLVIKIANTLDNVTIDNEIINCGAGVHLSALLMSTLKQGLTGLEFAAGIPGTLGGAIVMNAGTHEGNMGQVIQCVNVMDFDGNIRKFSGIDCNFSYRKSIFQNEKLMILGATIKLKKGDKNRISEKIKKLLAERKKKQPLGQPSAGCIFKNPLNYSAAELIEKAGLKSMRINDAQISGIHSNFIVNTGHAKASDVLALIDFVQYRIAKFGVYLNNEVRIIPETTCLE